MELDILKENWQKLQFEPSNHNPDIVNSIPNKKSLLHTRTITKRLFMFSLVEFLLWGFLGIGFQTFFKDYNPQSFIEFTPLIFLEKINYAVLGLFVLAFLLSFKTISIVGNVKQLIRRILNTKRIVNIYIYYNLVIFVISFLTSFIWELFNNDDLTTILQNKERFIYVAVIVFGTILTLAFAVLIYWIYRIIYGSMIINFQEHVKNLRKLDDEISD